MCEKIYLDFKSRLTEREIDIKIIRCMSVLFFIYMSILSIILYYNNKFITSIISSLIFIFITLLIVHTYIYTLVKKRNNLKRKDYFKFKRVYMLKEKTKKDIEILCEVLKENGVNTRSDVHEVLEFYRALLLRKSKQGIATISILSLFLSIFALIFPSLNYQNEKEVSIAISIIVAILLYLVLLCAFIKQVYRSVFYNLSKYYLIERIEALLLEIWIKQLI